MIRLLVQLGALCLAYNFGKQIGREQGRLSPTGQPRRRSFSEAGAAQTGERNEQG